MIEAPCASLDLGALDEAGNLYFYVFRVDEVNHVMVPSTDYAETAVVALNGGRDATEVFEMRGWGIRWFKMR